MYILSETSTVWDFHANSQMDLTFSCPSTPHLFILLPCLIYLLHPSVTTNSIFLPKVIQLSKPSPKSLTIYPFSEVTWILACSSRLNSQYPHIKKNAYHNCLLSLCNLIQDDCLARSIDGHLDCLQFLSIMNKATVNMVDHISLW